MDDFVRLNLNSVIFMFSAIFVLFIVLLIVLKYIHKEYDTYKELANSGKLGSFTIIEGNPSGIVVK